MNEARAIFGVTNGEVYTQDNLPDVNQNVSKKYDTTYMHGRIDSCQNS